MHRGYAETSLQLGLSGVLLAGFYAGAASGSALLAVVVLVLATLIGALLANLNAFFKYMLGMIGAAGNEGGGKATDVGAVAVEADAGHHHLNIVFVQAGIGAHFAGRDAATKGVKNGLILRGGCR
jgi:hypothetical protein